MASKIKGFQKLEVDLGTMQTLLKNPELATEPLDVLMTKHAPVLTGALKGSIYHKNNIAGAKAPYAGFVEEMDNEYAYATKAIKEFHMEDYADKIMEPLRGGR